MDAVQELRCHLSQVAAISPDPKVAAFISNMAAQLDYYLNLSSAAIQLLTEMEVPTTTDNMEWQVKRTTILKLLLDAFEDTVLTHRVEYVHNRSTLN